MPRMLFVSLLLAISFIAISVRAQRRFALPGPPTKNEIERGRYLASSGRDGAVRLWDMTKGALVHSLPIKGEVDSRLVFGADEESLLVATADATVRLFGRREPATGFSLPPDPARSVGR